MTLPLTIRKRDGRLEPFEPDKLARSLFAASEALGYPNALLARELTDGVLHFLAGEPSAISDTEQLAEWTVKVVRELGQPALAKIYHEAATAARIRAKEPASEVQAIDAPTPPSRDDVYSQVRKSAAAEIANYSLVHVYPRDLVSAHREGLLELLDLDTPFELSGIVLPGPYALDDWTMFDALRNARALAGSFVALDGLDYQLASSDGAVETLVRGFAESFDRARMAGVLRTVININCAEPPRWIGSATGGPLFGELPGSTDRERTDRVALRCLDCLRDARVSWHLSDRDFRDDAAERLGSVAELTLARDEVDFVFDSTRQPILLGPGLRRGQSALLGMVAMNLRRLVAHLGGGPLDRDLYLRKLASLARFARSAGRARLDFLRQHGDARLREAFLLDRAVQLIAPIDLVEAAQCVAGETATPEDVADLARLSLEAIRASFETDWPRTTVALIDYPLEAKHGFALDGFDISINKQLRQIATLQKAANGGFAVISLKPNASLIVKEVVELLHTAWRVGVQHLRLSWIR
jgi:ATP cone domain